MYSKLTPEFGDLPTKVVFESVEPGSPAAQLLYHQTQGAISAFHQKARMSRLISDQEGSHMMQALPDGGQMRYSYNFGIETVHVRLNPRVVAAAQEEAKLQVRRKLSTAYLAIDVVLTPKLYKALTQYSRTSEVIPSPTRHWYEPEFWTTIYKPANNLPLADFVALYDQSYGIVGEGYYWVMPDWIGYQTVTNMRYPGSGAIAGPIDDQPRADVTGRTGPALSPLIIYMAYGSDLGTGNGQTNIIAALYSVRDPAFGNGGGDTNVNKDKLEETSFFDTLFVAGVVADPEGDKPYATSTLASTGLVDDRLQLMKPRAGDVSISRQVTAANPVNAGTIGGGFLAKFEAEIAEGAEVPEFVYDIYVSSSNNIGANTPPDGPMVYTERRDVDVVVRAREFSGDEKPVAIHVTTNTQKRKRTSTVVASELGPRITPGPDVDSFPGRTVDWAFAALEKWTDLHGEPADPGAPKMGELKDQLAIARPVVTAPHVNFLRDAPVWAGPIAGMTRLCRITWTPSLIGRKGSTKITPG